MNRRRPHFLNQDQIEKSAAFIASQQQPSGEIPWMAGGKMDPWDHVHSAMGLATEREPQLLAAAYSLYLLLRSQDPEAAALQGISVTQVARIAMFIGASLAGVAGALYISEQDGLVAIVAFLKNTVLT